MILPRTADPKEDDTHFFMKSEEGFRFHFIRNASGKVSGMLIDNNEKQGKARKLD